MNKPTRMLRKVSLMALTDSVKLTYFRFQNKHCVLFVTITGNSIKRARVDLLEYSLKRSRDNFFFKCSDNSMELNVLLENKGGAKSIKRKMRNVWCYNISHAKPPC